MSMPSGPDYNGSAVLMARGKTRPGSTLIVCALAVSLMAAPVAAQEAHPEGSANGDVATEPGDASNEAQPKSGSGFKSIWSSGGSDVYVPGYIWHLPYKYSEEQISRYNTTAWGLGYGRTLRGSGANHPQSLFAIVAADSYSKPQYMVGYSWRARWHPGGGAFALSGGYTALVVGREDKFHYAPLPGLLPLGTVGFDRFELMGAYVPYFEVGYFFLRLNFGEGPRASRQK